MASLLSELIQWFSCVLLGMKEKFSKELLIVPVTSTVVPPDAVQPASNIAGKIVLLQSVIKPSCYFAKAARK